MYLSKQFFLKAKKSKFQGKLQPLQAKNTSKHGRMEVSLFWFSAS